MAHSGPPGAEGGVEKVTGVAVDLKGKEKVSGTVYPFGPSASTADLFPGENLVSPTQGTCNVPEAIMSL